MDVELHLGMARIQVDEIPPEQWDMPYAPQFIIEFHNGTGFITLTLRLEQGKWYDRNTRFNEDEQHLRYFEPDAGDNWNPDYQSPLQPVEIARIGQAIARHMVVHLNTYMGLFIPAFPNPTKN